MSDNHDLAVLAKLCEGEGVVIPVGEEALLTLSQCAVQTRYPGDPPSLDEAREAITIAKKVRKFARKYLNIK
jgi:HEPN domain-containing protein